MTKFVQIACIFIGLLHAERAAAETLRVMTYNVQWLVAEAGERPQAGWRDEAALEAHYQGVARVIAGRAPHVVNLVEVTKRESVERLAEMVNRMTGLGYRAWHAEMHDSQTGQDVAVLARVPLEIGWGPDEGRGLAHFYSRGADGRWRAAYRGRNGADDTSISKNAAYRVSVGGRCVAFLGLHLVARPNDPVRDRQRQAQAEVASRILREEVAADGCLPVVAGDLNDYDPDVADSEDRFSPSSATLRTIKDYDPHVAGDELVNVARLLPKARRYTAIWAGAPGGAARTMIDHVLVHRDLMRFVAGIDIVHGGDAEGVSDHWPVVVDFDLPRDEIAARGRGTARRDED